nr:uncharacterized protein LOC109166032 [Ipomoea batatas]
MITESGKVVYVVIASTNDREVLEKAVEVEFFHGRSRYLQITASKGVECSLFMNVIVNEHVFNMLAYTFEAILYKMLHRAIGRKSVIASGLAFFGINTIKSDEIMAWRTPMVNTTHPQMAATGPVTQAGNAGPIPAPVFAAYEPKDRTDPLYLHPSESPSLQLVTAQLEGRSNYHPWARAMHGDGIEIEEQNGYSLWRAVSPIVGRSVLWINTAEGVWSDLKKRFSQQNIFRIVEIHSEIYRTKQGTSSVNDYFTQLKLLWDELCQRNKLSPRARKCIFLGFANGVKGYKLFDLQSKEIFLSRDVCFYETSFPFHSNQSGQANENLDTSLVLLSEEAYYPGTAEQIHEATSSPESSPESHQQGQGDINDQSSPPNQVGDSVTEPVNEPQPRRSTRVRTAPSYLSDYTCQSATIKRTSPHVISNVLSYSGGIDRICLFRVWVIHRIRPDEGRLGGQQWRFNLGTYFIGPDRTGSARSFFLTDLPTVSPAVRVLPVLTPSIPVVSPSSSDDISNSSRSVPAVPESDHTPSSSPAPNLSRTTSSPTVSESSSAEQPAASVLVPSVSPATAPDLPAASGRPARIRKPNSRSSYELSNLLPSSFTHAAAGLLSSPPNSSQRRSPPVSSPPTPPARRRPAAQRRLQPVVVQQRRLQPVAVQQRRLQHRHRPAATHPAPSPSNFIIKTAYDAGCVDLFCDMVASSVVNGKPARGVAAGRRRAGGVAALLDGDGLEALEERRPAASGVGWSSATRRGPAASGVGWSSAARRGDRRRRA